MWNLILRYGLILAAALIAVKLVENSYFTRRISLEIYLGIIATAFLGIGAYVGWKVKRDKTIEVIKDLPFEGPDQNNVEALGLSKREMEVLQYLAQGHSNQEIADQLFVSLNTIKTHLNNLYVKLDVNRRTQAVVKARELQLIP